MRTRRRRRNVGRMLDVYNPPRLEVQRRLRGERVVEHVLRHLGADGERVAPLRVEAEER